MCKRPAAPRFTRLILGISSAGDCPVRFERAALVTVVLGGAHQAPRPARSYQQSRGKFNVLIPVISLQTWSLTPTQQALDDTGCVAFYGSSFYMTLHRHAVDDWTPVRDGEEAAQVPAGWEIADGHADDTRVCGARPWQSEWLVLDDGSACGTAMCPVPTFRGARPRTSKTFPPSHLRNRDANGPGPAETTKQEGVKNI